MNKREKRELLHIQIEDETIKASDIDIDLVMGYRGIYNRVIKRIVDIVLAVIILICVSPIYVCVTIAIAAEDGLPILYKADRGGLHGKKFKIYKFRSMVKNADKIGGGTTALNDSRITRVGSVIRKMKIDEIPNLLNVIKGDASFIGPRPELLRYTNLYTGTEKTILEVRPGMTDYSSIEFINLDEIVGGENADEMYECYVLPKKNKLRVKYAATVSLATDIKLFFLTIFKVLQKCYRFVAENKHD